MSAAAETAEATAGISIHALFPLAQAAFDKNEDCVPMLEALVQGVRRECVFSENEVIDDVNTSDIKFLLAEHMLAVALMRQSGGKESRLSALTRARAHLDRFLASARRLGAFEQTSADEETEQQYLDRIAAGRAYKGPSRETKIERFKKQKEAKRAIEETKGKKDEASVRQLWIERVKLAGLEALDELDAAIKEIEVLEFAAKASPEELERAQREKRSISSSGIEVTRVVSGGQALPRETFKDGVFRQFHRPPTMSLEEYAEKEMEKLKLREEAEKSGPKPMLSLDEIAERGLEDDVVQLDAATTKASRWDDWKDDHPKGAGVTKRY